MTSSHRDGPSRQWFTRLATVVDRTSAPRLAWLFLGWSWLASGPAWRVIVLPLLARMYVRAKGLPGELRGGRSELLQQNGMDGTYIFGRIGEHSGMDIVPTHRSGGFTLFRSA